MKEAILDDLAMQRSKLIAKRIKALSRGDFASAEKCWQAIEAIEKQLREKRG